MKKQIYRGIIMPVMMLFLLLSTGMTSQVTIGFQGAEPGDPWGYTTTGAGPEAITESTQSPNIVTGLASIVAGGNTGGGSCFSGGTGNGPSTARTITFNALNIASSSSFTRTLVFNWGNRFPVCNGTGWDSGENLTFRAYHDGVAQPIVTLASGNNNAAFDIHSNQYTWSIPPCVQSFSFYISVTTNRKDELLFVDNVTLTTPSLNPALAQPSAISGNTLICGGTSSTYSVTSTPGVAYTWSNLPPGAVFTSTNGAAASSSIAVNWGSASSGTYTLTVTPADLCHLNTGPSQTLEVTILPPPTPLFISGPSSLCSGDTITLTSNYASGNTWSTGATTQTINVGSAGVYSLSATGSCGVLNATYTVSQNPSPNASITPSGPTTFCQGGSVTLTSASPAGNAWSTGATTQSISVASSGTYSLNVSTVCGMDSSSIAVTVDPSSITPSITAGGPTTFCAGDSVMLSSNFASGNVWSTGATTPTIMVHNAGTYTLTVNTTCASGTATQTVGVTPILTASITPSGPTTFCQGGSVTLSSGSATGNTWSTGATTQTINVTTSGTYSLNVANACSMDSTTINITVDPSSITASITAGSSTSFCAGDSVMLSSNFATGNVWSTGATTPTIMVHSSGTYTLTVNTACASSSATQTVAVTATITAAITASGPTTFCQGGSVILTSNAASGNTWSTGATTQSISVSSAGNYSLTVNASCGTATAATQVVVNPLPTANITASGPASICAGDSVLLTASGGNSYTWSTGATGASIYAHAPGTYTVKSTNGCGNAFSSPVTITQLPSPLAQISGGGSICQGDSLLLTANGGNTYSWSTGATTPSIYIHNSGTYVVTAANACGTSTASANVSVSNVTAGFIADSTSGIAPLTVHFTNASSSNTVSANWNFGDGSSSNNDSPGHVYNSAGTYTVVLTVTNSNGCQSTYTMQIVVKDQASVLIIPNVFTPNGDHVNDLFVIHAEGISEFSMSIYDRWGLLMVESTDPAKGWDGHSAGGNETPEGTYFYIIKAKGDDARDYNEKGTVTLIR